MYPEDFHVKNVIRHLNKKLHGSEGESRLVEHDDVTSLLNDLSNLTVPELCKFTFHLEPYPLFGTYCNRTWDSALCWPTTKAGDTAYLPCFDQFNGISYNTLENASKICFENGTWSATANYSACQELDNRSGSGLDNTNSLTSLLYLIGYSISLVALLLAMSIFLYFKDLRCLRNTIHTNLMFTYLMADFMWILTALLQNYIQADLSVCVILILVLHYFHITTFFWMFVEGLYLYMLVVETFNRKNIQWKVYVLVGWGIPLIVVIIWGVAKAVSPDFLDEESMGGAADGIIILQKCHWVNASSNDWIFKVPILTVMAINSIFLVMIMWVLITKLRSANNAETQQYRKATKALMVLIPLLGVTYILTIVSSTDGLIAQVFYNLRAFMLSSQGFLVALFYCFLNSEVQNTVRHHMNSWRAARTLGGDRRYNYSSKDWSPRSRTESIRLYSQPTITPYRKRESSASEVTTTTLIAIPSSSVNTSKLSNGSTRVTSPFLSVSPENAV